jgi:putative membrane protein
VAGALYGPLAEKIPLPAALKGALWGMVVWSVSYLGWIPAAHILPLATHAPARRNFLMIVAHLVWGISTALLTEKLTSKEES